MRQQRAPKLNEQEVRALMDKHRIELCSILPPWEYPSKYKSLFRRIYDTADVKYQTYGATDQGTDMSILEIKARAQKLREDASDARTARVGEGTWRVLIEGNVVNRFEADLKCSGCKGYLWQSDNRVHTNKPQPEEQHGSTFRTRKLCACDANTRVRNFPHSPKSGSKRLFMPCESEPVIYDSDDRNDSGRVPTKKPDLVYGLAKTKSFQVLIANQRDLKHTPYCSVRKNVLYPFLVIEAKSEKNSPGFEAVEVQTAFPIKAFLKLQNQLNFKKTGAIEPLVWFMAYSGEQWHIYGCIIEDENYRIIDLWQGSIMSHDKALQLLLIVDIICEWAQEYRRNVQKCLAESVQRLREISPASTEASQSIRTVTQGPSFGRHLQSRSDRSVAAVLSSLTEDTEMQESVEVDAEQGSDHGDATDFEVIEHPPSMYDTLGLTILCSNSAKFEFNMIELPDRSSAMAQALLVLFPGLSTNQSVKVIGELLNASELVTTKDTIQKVASIWVRSSNSFVAQASQHCRVILCYFRYVQSGFWQITHSLLAITCSPTAMRCLQSLGLSQSILSDDSSFWRPVSGEAVIRTISAIRNESHGYLKVVQSTARWPLLLVAITDEPNWYEYEISQWTTESDGLPDPIYRLQHLIGQGLSIFTCLKTEEYDAGAFADGIDTHGDLRLKLSRREAVMLSVRDVGRHDTPNYLLLIRYKRAGWQTSDVVKLLRALLRRPTTEWCSPCQKAEEEEEFENFCDYCIDFIEGHDD